MNIMNNQYYQFSTDYKLADRILKEGQSIPVKLTLERGGESGLFTASQYCDEFWLVGAFVTDISNASDIDFSAYCADKLAEFLLPIPDPTIALQHSLKLALNECDELRHQITNWKAICDGAYSACAELTTKNKEIERLREALETVSSDAKVQIDGRDAALRGSTIEYKKLYQQTQILEDNLTRSESDRLSELTSIMRMLKAWESVPIQKWGGALTLIKRVIYDAICKLDPSQSIEL
jgi:hypothetical protein